MVAVWGAATPVAGGVEAERPLSALGMPAVADGATAFALSPAPRRGAIPHTVQ
jgi:hypothetical protein